MNYTKYKTKQNNWHIYETGNSLFKFAFVSDGYSHGNDQQGHADTLEQARQKIDELEQAK